MALAHCKTAHNRSGIDTLRTDRTQNHNEKNFVAINSLKIQLTYGNPLFIFLFQCYTDYQLRSVFGHFGNLSRDQVILMCPAFIQQIVGGACSAPHSDEGVTSDPNYTTAMSKNNFNSLL